MSTGPSPFMRKHTVGRLKTNPPKASAYARRKGKKRSAPKARRTGQAAPSWRTLGAARRLVFRSVAGTSITAGFDKGTRIDYAAAGGTLRITGPDLGKIAPHMPARPVSIDYGHAGGGGYSHKFGSKARATFNTTTREIRISGVRVKPFIEG